MFRPLLAVVALSGVFAAPAQAESNAVAREASLAQLQMAHLLRAMNEPMAAKRAGRSVDALDARIDELQRLANHAASDARAAKLGAAISLVEAVQRLQNNPAKRAALPREFQIVEDHPTHWRTAPMGDDLAACRRAVDHPLEQPLRISLSEPGTVWLRIAAPAPGTWAFDTFISEFDTRLSLYRDCRDIDQAPIESSDDALGMGSVVGFKAKTAGETRIVKLERIGGDGDLVVAKAVTAIMISGRVTRADTGQPVSGLYVAARHESNGGASNDATDSEGRYSIYYYYEGNYRLRTGRDYYYEAHPAADLVDMAWPNGPCLDRNINYLASCVGDIDTIELTHGEQATGVDFVLPKGATITGRVTSDLDGAPLEDVAVLLRLESSIHGNQTVQTVDTDASGRFRFFGVAPFEWRIQYHHLTHVRERWNDVLCGSPLASLECSLESGDTLAVEGDLSYRADASLTPLQVVPVSLRAEGQPVAGVVSVYTSNGLLFKNEYTNASGVTYVGPLPAGEYRLVAQANGYLGRVIGGASCYQDCLAQLFTGSIVVAPAAAGTLLIADLESFPSLSGTVTAAADAAPISDASVIAYRLGNAYPVATATTDVNGDYTLDGLPPASYFVHARAASFVDELYPDVSCESDRPLSQCTAQPLTFSLGEAPQDVDFALDEAGRVQGRVRAHASGQTEIALPTQVTLVRVSPLGATADTNYLQPLAGGYYGHSDVQMGTHQFVMRASGFRSQLYAGVDCSGFDYQTLLDCPWVAGTPLTWASATTHAGVNFVLTSNYSRVVRVRDADTLAPLSGVNVDEWSTDGTWRSSGITNAQGIAQVRLINPDPNQPATWYALVTTDNSLGYLDQVHADLECAPGTSAYAGTCALAGATAVQVFDPSNAPNPQIEILLRSADPLFKSDFE
jgi:hypothetical protein